MPISCNPDELAEVSSCLTCIPKANIEPIKIYLLAVTAGLEGLTATQLIEAARCYSCIPKEMQKPVQNYLLCQIANGGAAPVDCGNVEGAGDPT